MEQLAFFSPYDHITFNDIRGLMQFSAQLADCLRSERARRTIYLKEVHAMTFAVELPERMLTDIDNLLAKYEARTLPVYAEAESIRRIWLAENVALEDIVYQLVRGARARCIALEINSAQAADALQCPKLH
jgi:hypothetical protein